MDINVKGVWYGCKYAILAMRKSGGGSIINTASFVAILGAATPQLACKYHLELLFRSSTFQGQTLSSFAF